ncbi:MAG: nitronate monooxygenase family protein [Dehalococcoidia bacterium]
MVPRLIIFTGPYPDESTPFVDSCLHLMIPLIGRPPRGRREDKMFKTRLTELLGVEFPIIGGAMAYLSTAKLAAAVSNAGGFGLISSVTCNSKDELREHIRECRKLTEKPFGVNIALITRDPNRINEDLEVVVEEGVKFVETAAMNPAPHIERLKKDGITVLHKCATVRHAQSAERAGIDAVTLVGCEAAGHTGLDDLPLSIMIPLAVNSLKVPVVAAGGVGNGGALVAALALGAAGVQIGTILMASHECPASSTFKNWLIQTQATDTVYIERSLNRAYRVRRNEAAEKVLELEQRGISMVELLSLIGGDALRKVLFEGDVNAGVVACGPVAGLIENVASVKEIIDRIIREAQDVLEQLYTGRMVYR